MNENVNLKEILKDCPKGWGFWSKVHGEVTFRKINPCTNTYPIEVFSSEGIQCVFTENGRALYIHEGECILVPSKDQQDWSKFYAPWYKEKKFDPKTLKPFDKVLCRRDNFSIWQCNLFSHIHPDYKDMDYPVHCMSNTFMHCIPYNDETKHLVGTKDKAPKHYEYWEDL